MKRKWAYLGAWFPLSTAAAAWAAGAGGHEDPAGKFARSKNDAQDGDSEKLPDKPDSPEAGAPGVRTPSGSSGGDEAERPDHLTDNGQSLGDNVANVKILPPMGHDGMYAPSGAGAPLQSESGAAVPISRMATAVESPAESDETTLPVEPVEPPPDEHAMMILLGGMAEGTGEGAESSGEVVFDIVDYGNVTIGYGYAIFAAEGSDSATADTFYDVYGADLVFTFGSNDLGADSASSSIYVLALDFEFDLDTEEIAGLDQVNWLELLAQGPFAEVLGSEEGEPVSVDGNIALSSFTAESPTEESPLLGDGTMLTIENLGSAISAWLQSEQAKLLVQGEAQGVDTFVSGSGSLLEIEDQYSSVNGSLIGIG